MPSASNHRSSSRILCTVIRVFLDIQVRRLVPCAGTTILRDYCIILQDLNLKGPDCCTISGAERIADTLREHIRLAHLLAGWVDASPGFERLAPTDFSLVCLRFRPAGASDEETDAANERLLHAINETGEFFLSHTKLRGRYTIRVAIGNLRTTEEHVRRLWELLQELAHSDTRRTDGR